MVKVLVLGVLSCVVEQAVALPVFVQLVLVITTELPDTVNVPVTEVLPTSTPLTKSITIML
jgi:hypothetical protein